MIVAFIEEKLGYLHKPYFVENKKFCKKLLKGNGVLTTFTSKIDLTFLLGLIPKNIFKNFHLLRKKLNKFAHTASKISFKTPFTKDRIKALSELNKKILRNIIQKYTLYII